VTAGAVASRVAEAFHSTTDPTRPPEGCVPQRVRQPRLPSRLPRRPAGPAARAPPRRLPPGDDPALPARLAREPDRRAARLRPRHRAPLDPPLPPARHRRAGRPAPQRPSTTGQPPAGPAHPPAARPAQGLDIGRLWQQLGRPTISLRTLHRRVRKVACWRRPRLVARGNPDRDQILTDLHQHIRDLPTGAVLWAEDEAHSNLLPWVRATWILRGQRQQVMTPGTNRRRTIFGAVDLATGRFLYQATRKAISASFTTFSDHLLAASPQAPVVAVVCDNVIIHRSKTVQRWLKTHPRLLVLHGVRLQPPRHPRRAGVGRAQGVAGQQPNLDNPGAVCARCTPSSASAPPRSCWPRRPTARPGPGTGPAPPPGYGGSSGAVRKVSATTAAATTSRPTTASGATAAAGGSGQQHQPEQGGQHDPARVHIHGRPAGAGRRPRRGRDRRMRGGAIPLAGHPSGRHAQPSTCHGLWSWGSLAGGRDGLLRRPVRPRPERR
jgi:hypothetical protein